MTPGRVPLDVLASIERRVLWLATWMVHHANTARPPADGLKVGGHQASSASLVSLMTALYFGALRAGDVVAVKAHAAPAFYAIEYLRGRLEAHDLASLRVFEGLQAYPSRRRNPAVVELAAGSMGLGAVSALFGGLAVRYVADHGGPASPDRFIAMVGDAELDEGNVWEALGEEVVSRLGNVLWIVDVNRQSLDRVIADERPRQLAEMFRAAGWAVIELRWGGRLSSLLARRGGDRLQRRLESMGHRAYQRLLRLAPGEVRKALVADPAGGVDLALDRFVASIEDTALASLVADLGGHDLASILTAYETAARERTRPTVILASTIKGWKLPFAGDPANHGMVTTPSQVEALRAALGVAAGSEWARFADGSAEQAWIARCPPPYAPPPLTAGPDVPATLDEAYGDETSTQEAFGRVLAALARTPAGERIVTVSADVAATTHLGGWINRTGVWWPQARRDPFAGVPQALTWRESPAGRHIELGIAEHDLFLALGALGLTAELSGMALLPIGTVYDPFVARGLDALHHALYAGGRFVVVATPSGVTLSPEGGAHQSVITPPLGVAMPGLTSFEPAFAREVEWILLHALAGIAARTHESIYIRLSTRLVRQALSPLALAGWRGGTLAGGYRLIDARSMRGWAAERAVSIFAMGAVVTEAVVAAQALAPRDIHASVFVVTSADLLYRDLRTPRPRLLALVGADEEDVPIVSVLDGHSSALAFLGGGLGVPQTALGVDAFGQSGSRAALYRHYEIDADAIVSAARALVGDR